MAENQFNENFVFDFKPPQMESLVSKIKMIILERKNNLFESQKMKRIGLGIIPLVLLFCGCVGEVEKPTTDAVEDQLIGKWQSEPVDSATERTRTEIRFSAGKITKMELRERSPGTFVPVETAKGGRKSETFFYRVDSADDSKISLTVSTEFEFSSENIQRIEIEIVGEDELVWTDEEGRSVRVNKTK